MGYWNPVTEEYVATRFLRFLLAAAEEYGRTRIPSRSEDLKGYIRHRLDVAEDEVADAEEDTVENEPQDEPIRPYIVVLDEMNLARVEYYLADVLSVLESGRREDGFTRGEIYLHGRPGDVLTSDGLRVPPRLRLPPNLYFVGTVNVDETTFAFSPKVLDRAFTIEVKDVDLTDYPPGVDLTGRPAGVAAAGRPVRGRGV
nr:MAG: hypothetical protein DIU55_13875 [Bacillota bacterium]